MISTLSLFPAVFSNTRVFKGRYFRNASPMELIRSYSSSYGWRIILSAKSLVSKGLIKMVESGSSISLWNDHWLPSTLLGITNKNQHNLYPELTVDSLIDGIFRTWNLQVIWTMADPQDMKIIESTPLSRFHTEDRMDGILQTMTDTRLNMDIKWSECIRTEKEYHLCMVLRSPH